MYNNILVIGIILLFILSTVGSMAIGFDTINFQDDKLECPLDNLRFMCTEPSGFNSVKYE